MTRLGKRFEHSTKSTILKRKKDKLNYTKIQKTLPCTSKDIIKKIKRQATDWEKVFANHMSDKRHGP